MVRAKILTKIIFGMALFVFQSAQSLETGYAYPRNVRVAEHVLHNDLKCTYLYGGLTHLLVVRHLSAAPLYSNLATTVGQIINYSRIIKYQLDSLYRLRIMRIGALWLLHLYTTMMYGFYHNSSNKEEDGRNVMATHDYIIAQLRKDLADCRKGNSFNSYEMLRFSISYPPLTILMDLRDKNIARAKNLLTKNNICGLPFNKYDGQTFKVGSLQLNNLGINDVFKEDLMGVFNVQVEWHGTGEVLNNSWYASRRFFFSTNKFENIQLYYKLSFDFLKIIAFRLTLKHLCYIETIENTDLRPYYSNAWYHIIKQFGDMLGLSEDLHIKHLLVSFDNLIKQEEKIDSVASYLIAILKTLCLSFGCEAANEFKLNGEEFQIPFNSLQKDEIDGLNITKSPVPIEYHSLENARAFLYHLRCMFKNVDFNVIWLLIEYINEMNSGNCIDGVENFHRDTFNFDYL